MKPSLPPLQLPVPMTRRTAEFGGAMRWYFKSGIWNDRHVGSHDFESVLILATSLMLGRKEIIWCLTCSGQTRDFIIHVFCRRRCRLDWPSGSDRRPGIHVENVAKDWTEVEGFSTAQIFGLIPTCPPNFPNFHVNCPGFFSIGAAPGQLVSIINFVSRRLIYNLRGETLN